MHVPLMLGLDRLSGLDRYDGLCGLSGLDRYDGLGGLAIFDQVSANYLARWDGIACVQARPTGQVDGTDQIGSDQCHYCCSGSASTFAAIDRLAFANTGSPIAAL